MIACFVADGIGVACERARVPNLWGEPFAIEADDVLAAVSPEALPFGVRVGQQTTYARTLCQGLILLPYDREAYLKAAEAVWDGIAVETSIVEPVSPEVAYAEMSGVLIVPRIKALSAQIMEAANTQVRVGLGSSKLIAQLAARRKTVSNVVVATGREAALLSPAPLSALTMLPAKARAKADKLGIKTLGDVLALPPTEIERQFKDAALMLRRLTVGDDGDPVKAIWPLQAAAHAIRFDDEVDDDRFIDHALRLCAEKIAAELAIGRRFCRTLSLEAEMGCAGAAVQREELNSPLHEIDTLHRAALRLYHRMTLSSPITRLEVTASELTIGSSVQLTLLSEDDSLTPDQRRSLDASVAHLKEKFGIGAVVSAKLINKAQRVDLWTYRLGHISNEPVEVQTDSCGDPRVIRRGFTHKHDAAEYAILQVQDKWRESDWSWGKLTDKTCYRVLTDPPGLYELHESGGTWSLRAAAD